MPSSHHRGKTGTAAMGADIRRLTPLGSTRTARREECSTASSTRTAANTAGNTNDDTDRPLCRFFVLGGNCRYGAASCAYSHVLPAGGLVEARGRIPCPFYARGTCRHGDACHLRHDGRGGRREDQVHAGSNNGSKPPPSAHTCGICMENMASTGRRFGLLSCGCPHTFCFDCLMEWRQAGSREATDRWSCPACRQHSDFVVPSDTFVAKGERQRVVDEYKAKLARIPCKKYKRGLKRGSCPFGRDCLYAHRGRDGRDVKGGEKSMRELHEERMARRLRRRTGDDIDTINQFLLMLDLYTSGSFRAIWDDDDDDDDEGSNFDYSDFEIVD